MMFRSALLLAATLLLTLNSIGRAQTPQPTPTLSNPFAGLGNMAEAAKDLRGAGEAFERVAKIAERIAEPVAAALASISSEFDPFGYKTAFRLVGEQSEMLQRQRDTIRELQEREILRLESQAKKLKKRLKNQRKKRQAKSKRSAESSR